MKPFVKRVKNDRNDAEAISGAASRPTMRWVPVKTVAEQAATIIVKHSEMLVGQRTQAVNALRCHAMEFGIVAAKCEQNVAALLATLAASAAIPAAAREMSAEMDRYIAELDGKIEILDRQLLAWHEANPIGCLPAEIPDVGPVTAIAMALMVNPANVESGRHWAAWLGPTPKEHSTGGKRRPGGISKSWR